MHLDDEQSKYIKFEEIKCTCGSDITLKGELLSKDGEKHIQYIFKCSNNKSPENVLCCRSGFMKNNELFYFWD
jgi:hypothetical protein